MTRLILLLIALNLFFQARTQTCTAAGQNPNTAFPVCGTSTFTQASVPLCGGREVPSPTCPANTLQDVNPFWYKFTCFETGTLGFKITPHTNTEDYDWQLYDITGRNFSEVYTNIGIVVASNWSGEGGETGASAAGTQTYVCGGLGRPLWSKMPSLQAGHDYLLLISHFSNTQSGYNLSFGGGTAVITDTTTPRLRKAEANCAGTSLRVKLNKKMKCSSVATGGSDFFLMPGNIPFTNVIPVGCATGFDTDSLILTLAAPLAPGTYTLNVKNGSDGNTLLDYCDSPLPLTEQASFTIVPNQPTPMDSIVPAACKPQSVKLIFSKPVLCASIAPDGSDFVVNGTYPVTVTSAAGACGTGAYTREIVLNFSATLFDEGSFNVVLQNGTDNNTLVDECTLQTPAGSSVSFFVKDTVNARFTTEKFYGCTADTIRCFHPGGNGVNSWQWNLDDGKTSLLQNPEATYTVFEDKNISLVVSNGFCTDSSAAVVSLDNYIKAAFTAFDDLCPNEPTQFTSNAEGRLLQHRWTFGDGNSSTDESPGHVYAGANSTTTYTVRYTITDSIGCQSTAQKPVKVYSSCLLAVPTGFTPNNDGRNDIFSPLNAVKAEKLDFRVYNRWGQLVFKTSNWKQGWNGSSNGLQQPTGVYVWFLSFVDRDTKQARQMKGTVALIR